MREASYPPCGTHSGLFFCRLGQSFPRGAKKDIFYTKTASGAVDNGMKRAV